MRFNRKNTTTINIYSLNGEYLYSAHGFHNANKQLCLDTAKNILKAHKKKGIFQVVLFNSDLVFSKNVRV